MRNQTIDELCDKVKSRGGVGCSEPAQCFIKVTKEVNWCMQLGTFFFPSLKASGEEETKKKMENWNLTCLHIFLITNSNSSPTNVGG